MYFFSMKFYNLQEHISWSVLPSLQEDAALRYTYCCMWANTLTNNNHNKCFFDLWVTQHWNYHKCNWLSSLNIWRHTCARDLPPNQWYFNLWPSFISHRDMQSNSIADVTAVYCFGIKLMSLHVSNGIIVSYIITGSESMDLSLSLQIKTGAQSTDRVVSNKVLLYC